jgi:hypothetical protein
MLIYRIRDWVGSGADLDTVQKGNVLPCWEMNCGQPVNSLVIILTELLPYKFYK